MFVILRELRSTTKNFSVVIIHAAMVLEKV